MRGQAARMQTVSCGGKDCPTSCLPGGYWPLFEGRRCNVFFFSGASGHNAFQIRRSAACHGKEATLRGGRDRLDPRPLGPGARHSQQRRPPAQFALTPFASSTWLKPCTFSLGSMRFAVFKRREHHLAFPRFFFLTACAPTP